MPSGDSYADGTIIVRGYSPHGLYWQEGLVFPDAIYAPESDFVLTAVRTRPVDLSKHPFSEFDDPTLEEFRLLAALVLSVGYDDGLICPFPLNAALRLEEPWDPAAPGTVDALRRRLQAHWQECPPAAHAGPLWGSDARIGFDLRGSSPVQLQRRIYDAIDPNDHVMSRGMRTLVRGLMLSFHPLFAEEAIYPLSVALDASFALFRRVLRAQGAQDPKSADVAAYFETVFGEALSGEGYFKDFYDDRIMSLHPESRLGTSAYVPGTHGERLWLFKGLREAYRFLILGEVVDPRNAGR